nr:MAG TPA: hypothetical protein [Bacteriophage sp.]
MPYIRSAKNYHYICTVTEQILTFSASWQTFGTPISQRCFFGTSRIFSNPAANCKAVGGW